MNYSTSGFIFFMMTMIILFRPSTAIIDDEEAEINNPLYELSSREELVRLAGYGEEKLSTVLVTGSLHCNSFPVSGASVAIRCGKWSQESSAATEAETDVYGEFQIDVPSHLHAIPNLGTECSLIVLRVPKQSACLPTITETKMLTLLLARDGVRIYTAGDVRLSKQSTVSYR
ncbi:uncharacterized protein LOC126666225 [Mercurialis annua]|uniref:uncharacterized protein LOC126666225 n=1 Tax=Mercurialis annua TaxID=3986 RepID=UPI002160A2EE|nr:uncharacterized protein LOC126666225 [Mercurialis annua]